MGAFKSGSCVADTFPVFNPTLQGVCARQQRARDFPILFWDWIVRPATVNCRGPNSS
jgi:hypothetical protein